MFDRAVIAIHFRRKNETLRLAAGFHGPAARIAGRGNRSGRGAVIRAITRNDFGFSSVHARDLESGFVRVRSGSGEEEFFKTFRQNFQQQIAQLRARLRRVGRRNVGKSARLLLDGANYGRILVAEIDAHQL